MNAPNPDSIARLIGGDNGCPMVWLRSLIAVALALLVTVTSQEMAILRGQTGAVGTAVLCIGEVAVEVAVDADGKPVGPRHICPDCALNVIVALATPDLPQRVVIGRALTLLPVHDIHAAEAQRLIPSARGPPVIA